MLCGIIHFNPPSPVLATPTTAAPFALALLPELDHELLLTRRVLARVPADRFDWQPHPKSMTLGRLASHTADLLGGIEMTLHTTEVDLATVNFSVSACANVAELLRQLDASGTAARAALTAAAPSEFEQSWTLRQGPQVILQHSRAEIVRHLVSHTIHHRGQLCVYLRLLNVPVPYVYGPSADEASLD